MRANVRAKELGTDKTGVHFRALRVFDGAYVINKKNWQEITEQQARARARGGCSFCANKDVGLFVVHDAHVY